MNEADCSRREERAEASRRPLVADADSDCGEHLRYVLVGLPVITDTVLAHLAAKSLNGAALVCRAWCESARRVRRHRDKRVACFLGQVASRRVSSDVYTALVEFDFDFLQELACQPRTAIVFTTENVMEGKGALYPPIRASAEGSGAPRRKKERFLKYLHRLLPATTAILGVAASGVIGTDHVTGMAEELEADDAAFAALCLPEIPGLQVHHFYLAVDGQSLCSLRPDWRRSRHWLSDDPHVKCLLLFHDNSQDGELKMIRKDICSDIWKRLGEQVVMGGAYVEYVFGPDQIAVDNDLVESSFLMIAFSGEHVRAASVLIGSSTQTADESAAAIAKLKRAGLREDKSFAFIFACVGRGSYMYGQYNVEVEAFRKLFPKTPVIGVFGNGEIGIEGSKPQDGRRSELPRMDHAYSSVIIMVSVEK